jgi:hypothetical protein
MDRPETHPLRLTSPRIHAPKRTTGGSQRTTGRWPPRQPAERGLSKVDLALPAANRQPPTASRQSRVRRPAGRTPAAGRGGATGARVGCQTRGRSGRRSPTRVDGQATAGPRLPVATTDTKSPSRVGVTGRPQSRAAGPSLPGLAGPTGLRLPTQVAITGQASLGRRRGGRPGQAAGRAARGRAGRGGPGQAGRARRAGAGRAGPGRGGAGRAGRPDLSGRAAGLRLPAGLAGPTEPAGWRLPRRVAAAVAELTADITGQAATGQQLSTPGCRHRARVDGQSAAGPRLPGCGCQRRGCQHRSRQRADGRWAAAAVAGLPTTVADRRKSVAGPRLPMPGCRHRSRINGQTSPGRQPLSCGRRRRAADTAVITRQTAAGQSAARLRLPGRSCQRRSRDRQAIGRRAAAATPDRRRRSPSPSRPSPVARRRAAGRGPTCREQGASNRTRPQPPATSAMTTEWATPAQQRTPRSAPRAHPQRPHPRPPPLTPS